MNKHMCKQQGIFSNQELNVGVFTVFQGEATSDEKMHERVKWQSVKNLGLAGRQTQVGRERIYL